MNSLPNARGPVSRALIEHVSDPPHEFVAPTPTGDPLTDDDLHLALYHCYVLSYRGLAGVDERWEGHPSLAGARRTLEDFFEAGLRDRVLVVDAGGDVTDKLRAVAALDLGPSLSDFMQTSATRDQFLEFMIHRSAYQLKEADPHSWVLPRLSGRAKAALVEVQFDEYGGGRPERIHAQLFADAMAAAGLDATYGAYLDVTPGVTLATVNLMSFFGFNRRLRGAAVGHLALFEMTSSLPNRKYANGLRRVGLGASTPFFDEHVEADAVHEMIALHDLAGSLAQDEPAVTGDIVFGAHALAYLEAAFAGHLLDAWEAGGSSLLRPGASVRAS